MSRDIYDIYDNGWVSLTDQLGGFFADAAKSRMSVRTARHYVDLSSAMAGLMLSPLGYLLQAFRLLG